MEATILFRLKKKIAITDCYCCSPNSAEYLGLGVEQSRVDLLSITAISLGGIMAHKNLPVSTR